MLQKEAVSPETLELLMRLMEDKELEGFFLVGGTALALQIGHRLSIDIDLFSLLPFDSNALLSLLESRYSFQLDYQARNTLKGQISKVKTDFITYSYPLSEPLLRYEKDTYGQHAGYCCNETQCDRRKWHKAQRFCGYCFFIFPYAIISHAGCLYQKIFYKKSRYGAGSIRLPQRHRFQ